MPYQVEDIKKIESVQAGEIGMQKNSLISDSLMNNKFVPPGPLIRANFFSYSAQLVLRTSCHQTLSSQTHLCCSRS